MRRFSLGFAVFALAILTGCAHPIVISPNLSEVQAHAMGGKKINASVGYYIPDSVSSLEVTTPGGGGDNVRYFPYRDIELGYQTVLKSIFPSVVKVSTASPKRDKGEVLDYVIEPVIVTNSGSTGFFTWPPTNFSVDITNKIRDRENRLVDSPRVVGIGVAETGEKLREHGIAGRRAIEDALKKMRTSLLESKLNERSLGQGKNKNISEDSSPSSSVEDRLKRLLELKSKGLITPEEYDKKKREIIENL